MGGIKSIPTPLFGSVTTPHLKGRIYQTDGVGTLRSTCHSASNHHNIYTTIKCLTE